MIGEVHTCAPPPGWLIFSAGNPLVEIALIPMGAPCLRCGRDVYDNGIVFGRSRGYAFCSSCHEAVHTRPFEWKPWRPDPFEWQPFPVWLAERASRFSEEFLATQMGWLREAWLNDEVTSWSGETSKLAEMRACLLGFEHLASLRRQGWTWMIPRLDYHSDCCAVINALNKLRNRDPEGDSEQAGILRLIRSSWETIGFRDLRLHIANERKDSNIRFCDTMSKYVRNTWVAGF